MTPLPVAVIGCGHLGRIHARLLSQLENVRLVGVTDPRPAAREAVAREAQTEAFADIHEMLGEIEAAVIAAPTSLHARVGLDLIDHGIHLLIEKPLAPTLAEAEQLAEAARRAGTVLAVGHVERFNPAFQMAARRIDQPIYVEAVRTGPFTFRSMDTGVVMDLMVHDLELVLSLVNSPIVGVSAVGAPVVTSSEDFAEAHVTFANGCVARFFASRVTPSPERRLSLFGSDLHAVVDLNARTVRWMERCPELQRGEWQVERWNGAEIAACQNTVFEKMLPVHSDTAPEANPLRDELSDFVDSIQRHRAPRVPARQGLRAVALAEEILHLVRTSSSQRLLSSLPTRRAA